MLYPTTLVMVQLVEIDFNGKPGSTYMINTMASGDLPTQGAMTSVAIVFV